MPFFKCRDEFFHNYVRVQVNDCRALYRPAGAKSRSPFWLSAVRSWAAFGTRAAIYALGAAPRARRTALTEFLSCAVTELAPAVQDWCREQCVIAYGIIDGTRPESIPNGFPILRQ